MIKQTYKIKAPVKKVWEALVQPKDIAAWSGSPAKMNAKVGTKFSLWDGEIFGKNILVEPQKKLVQEWYGGKAELSQSHAQRGGKRRIEAVYCHKKLN
jgi:activator of HSP90 ATPase